ncbi:DUF1835 domain-containing protein [Chondrinema litorale]|uniref:DUF1835 domain-containing protein n=1 Tax=Chondrinema litorale TaxID=2994555 RepID=UPI002543344E|nr:hypothetical protein [Chondrinema litorale]UZR94971.1 hypothetical protein OQ292_03975 [Chondrinema litorale]
MPNTIQYHIFNGDSSKEAFLHSPLNSDAHVKIAWREMLCEGPVNEPILSDAFFYTRAKYLHETYGIDLNDFENGKSELLRITQISADADITLWFEYDLFCQLNMMATLSYLAGKHTNIYLVCAGVEEGKKGLQTLGHYKPDDYPQLFARRIKLSQADITFAQNVWQAYAFGTPEKLEQLLRRNTPDTFPYLNSAIKAHFKRFPSTTNGLSEAQHKILTFASNEKLSKNQLVGKLLRSENTLGFGDLQYFHLIDNLSILLKIEEERVTINNTGKEILSGKKDFTQISDKQYYLGAVLNNNYRWDDTYKKLIPLSS